MHYWMNSEIFMCCRVTSEQHSCTFTQVFTGKVEGGTGQDPATEVTHLRLVKSTSRFFFCFFFYSLEFTLTLGYRSLAFTLFFGCQQFRHQTSLKTTCSHSVQTFDFTN